MKPEIKTLLENLEFHEKEDKPGLWSRRLEKSDMDGEVRGIAYIYFRRPEVAEKGRRFYTIEGTDGFFDQTEDVNTIPVLQYFKERRDEILTGATPISVESEQRFPIQSLLPPKKPSEYSGMIQPVATLEKAIEIFKLYEDAKSKILGENDVLWIGEDGKPTTVGKGRPHIKRSGWRKLARFFGLSCHIISREKIMNGDGKNYQWIYHVMASHPSGATQDAQGVASSKDKFFTKGGRIEAKEENVILKAQTVAFNRAISDLLGGGEVSAEEVE